VHFPDQKNLPGRAVAKFMVVCAVTVFCCLNFVSGRAMAQLTADSPGKAPDQITPIRIGSLTLSGELSGRGQGWDWFLGGARTRYAFGSSLLRLGLSQEGSKLSWKVELSQPTLYSLPNDAFEPGTGFPLGLGATYFTANGGQRTVAGIFIKQAYVSIRGIDHNGGTLRVGRFEFADGMEKMPAATDLAWLKQQRIASRLVGDADWTGVGRSFDGLHFSDDIGDKNNLTFVAARATRGVWQTDGMGEMDVDVLYGAYTRELPTVHTASEFRVFALGYHDGRGVLKVDNRPLAARLADSHNIRIGTLGVNFAIVAPIRYVGKWDLLAWGAEQIGQWGVLRHHADAGVVEMGWRPPIPWIHPWLRAGASYATGDGNPNDDRHTTFFQPLPTEQQYARTPFYTGQNSEDYTGQLILEPTHKLELRSEVHKVKLHSVNDLWYLGTGAFQNSSFGYDGLPNHGHKGLANYVDFSAGYQPTAHVYVYYYVGAVSGKGAMTNRVEGRKGGFTFLEVDYKF
jgi:hypothetical protein